MKVYVLEQIYFDWHRFSTVIGVYSTIEEMSEGLDSPLFESESKELEAFEDDNELDGLTHYEYTEYEVKQ